MGGYVVACFSLYLPLYQINKVLLDFLGILILLFFSIDTVFNQNKKFKCEAEVAVWVLYLVVVALLYWGLWARFSLESKSWNHDFVRPLINAVLLALFLGNFRVNKQYICWVIFLLPVFNGIASLYEYFVLLDGIGRVELQINLPVLYGGMSVCSVGLAVVLAFSNFMQRQWLMVFAVLMGASAVILSGSRAAYSVLFFIGCAFIGWHLWKALLNRSFKLPLILLISLIALCYVTSPMLVKRYAHTLTEFDYLSENKPTSIGTRLKLWEVGIDLIDQNPLTGLGMEGMARYIENYNSERNYQAFTEGVNHPHSDILVAWYAGGVVGLLALFLIYAFPLWYAYRHCSLFYQRLVFTLVSSYLVLGLSDSFLLQTVSLKYYFVFLTLFCISGSNEKKQKVRATERLPKHFVS